MMVFMSPLEATSKLNPTPPFIPCSGREERISSSPYGRLKEALYAFPPGCVSVLALLLGLLSACAGSRTDATPPEECNVEAPTPRDAVVLVHGLGRSSQTFSRIVPALQERGYRTVPFEYASLRDDLQSCGEQLRSVLDELEADDSVSRIHLITHSMGGSVTRSALGEAAPTKVHRVVMMAPPNQGSGLATSLEGALGRFIPAIRELSNRQDSPARKLPVPEGVEVGVIAANWDHVVERESTHLPGQADHILLRGMHSSIPYQETVRTQALHFLEHGLFQHDSDPGEPDS